MKTRASLALLSVITVVGCGVAGCDHHSDRPPQETTSSASSPISPAGVSSSKTPLRPSLDAGGETTPRTDSDTGGDSDAQTSQDISRGSGNHIANPDQIGGYCGTTYDGDEIEADEKTSCGFAGAIFTSAMKQRYHEQNDLSGPSLFRADFTQTSPTTGKNYTVVCVASYPLNALSCSEKFKDNGDDLGSFRVSYVSGTRYRFASLVDE